MHTSLPIPKQTVGKTFLIAISILGIAALAQLCAVSWVFISRFQVITQSQLNNEQRVFTGKANVSTNVSTNQKSTEELMFPETYAPTKPPSLPKPTPIQQRKTPSTVESRLNELVEQAKALRARGDNSTALVKLREAQAIFSDRPLVISEMAITYENMGLNEKALEQWRRIYEIGDSSGIYYSAAEAKLNRGQLITPSGQSSKTEVTGETSGLQPGSVIGLADITMVEGNNPAGSKKFTLRIPLKARSTAKLDIRDVVIQVFFYDMVSNENIVQTNANVSSQWSTLPADWSDQEIEILEVDYLQSTLDSKDPKQVENRKYFGYVVRVYYKNDLQDMRAEPMKLLKLYPPPLTLQIE